MDDVTRRHHAGGAVVGAHHELAGLGEVGGGPDQVGSPRELDAHPRAERGGVRPQLVDHPGAVAPAGGELGQQRGEQPVAVALAWWCAGRLSTYQVARSLEREHAHAGTLMMVDMIEQGVADGATEADLLRGDAAYKLRLADERRHLLLVRTGIGVLPRAVLGAHAARQRLRAGRRAFTRSSPSDSSPED